MSFHLLATLSIALALTAANVSQQPTRPRPAPVPDAQPPKLLRAAESKCNECHAAIVEEWASTAHAKAWADELYQEELKGRKKAESCHPCHVPKPLHGPELASKPEARADERHFGVSCESCHLAPDGALLGPLGAPTDKHATRKSETLSGVGSNALCAACHRTTVGPVIGIAKDFEQSELPAQGRSCVECHLSVLREVEHDGVKRAVRSHELQTPRDPLFLASAFAVTAVKVGGKTEVRLKNQAGHRVPGLIGRGLDFRARALDAAGKELAQAQATLDSSSHLPLGETLVLELGAAAAKVTLIGMHTDPRLAEPVRFLELELTP